MDNTKQFDFKNPDYSAVFSERSVRLKRMRENPETVPVLKAYYKNNIAQFITDWGCTVDPRNVAVGLPSVIPFILFPKQIEWIEWFLERWANSENGMVEKSRDMGASWLTIATACSICLFNNGVIGGFGSRKEEYVDKIGNPHSLFDKARQFLSLLPTEFAGNWNAPHMRVLFEDTGSSLTGESGDGIGRGARTSFYFVDEASFLDRPQLVEASLSQTTNCRIDVSTPNGIGNPFAEKKRAGRIPCFTFHWRAQPLDAGILTPNGWTSMGDVNIGDYVIGLDGFPKEVLNVTPQGRKEVFKVLFSDGASTECCGDHLWSVIQYGNQRHERRHIRKVMRLKDIAADYIQYDKRGFKRHNYQIPLAETIQFSQGDILPIDSYVLGALLGDGSFPKNNIRPIVMSEPKQDSEIIALMNARLPVGCSLKHDGGLQYRMSADNSHCGGELGRGRHNPVNSAIRNMGLSGKVSHTKFVPSVYLFASPSDRLELLQGLMDTDGGVTKNNPGIGRFSTVSKQLAKDVVFIAQSLGGIAITHNIKEGRRIFPGGRSHDCKNGYIVDVRLPVTMCPFKMERKASVYRASGRHPARRSIVGIDSVGEKECQCIEVKDHLYLTDNCIVTHNSDPRKDEAWYERQKSILDPVTLAQEIDINYSASVEGVLIPSEWVQAAIDADAKLMISPSGVRKGALDVADEGRDENSFAGRHGISLEYLESWKGVGSDIFATVERAVMICDTESYQSFDYDADGLGAGVRGDARIINIRREEQGEKQIPVIAFRGSGEVVKPDAQTVPGRRNKDMFANAKAQAWWMLRLRFQATFRAVNGDPPEDTDNLISISSKIPCLAKLCMELSQPTYSLNGSGKILIDKTPEGCKSPNLSDSVMIAFSSSQMSTAEVKKLRLKNQENIHHFNVSPAGWMG